MRFHHTSRPLSPVMQTFLSQTFRTVTRHMLGLTLYDMMESSHDFEDVKAALLDRMEWSVELFRSCFTIHLGNGGSFFTLCALCFLIIAENIHIHHVRLSPAELKERAEQIGYATFAILFAVLDIGFIVVRVAGLVALSGSPALAVGLVLVSMSPSVILPTLTYPARLAKRRKRASTGDAEMNADAVVDESKTEAS